MTPEQLATVEALSPEVPGEAYTGVTYLAPGEREAIRAVLTRVKALEGGRLELQTTLSKCADAAHDASDRAQRATYDLQTAMDRMTQAEAWKAAVMAEAVRMAERDAPPLIMRPDAGSLSVPIETYNEMATLAWRAAGIVKAFSERPEAGEANRYHQSLGAKWERQAIAKWLRGTWAADVMFQHAARWADAIEKREGHPKEGT